jgi:hypothetical protein
LGAERKGSFLVIILILAAIAVAVVLAFLKPGAPGENLPASKSPKFKHTVRGIKFIESTPKPDERRKGQ